MNELVKVAIKTVAVSALAVCAGAIYNKALATSKAKTIERIAHDAGYDNVVTRNGNDVVFEHRHCMVKINTKTNQCSYSFPKTVDNLLATTGMGMRLGALIDAPNAERVLSLVGIVIDGNS